MLWVLIGTCVAIILTVILVKKYALKVDYNKYSKESDHLKHLVKTEPVKSEKDILEDEKPDEE